MSPRGLDELVRLYPAECSLERDVCERDRALALRIVAGIIVFGFALVFAVLKIGGAWT